MTLHSYIPAAPLSHFVNEIWLWEGYHPPHPKERILPGGVMELVINLSEEGFRMYYPADPYQPHRFHGPLVAGPRSEHFLVDTTRPASILGVYFKPGAALPFFKTSGRELHNLHVPLDTFWQARAHDLYCRLLEAKSPAERFHIVEQALLVQLARYQARHRAIGFALSAFHSTPHMQTVKQVVNQIGLSPTRFIQVFSEEIGLTPKLYCRVLRFQEALRLSVQRGATNWADIALSCGYYDQSHFINDFQELAGISPTLYFPQNPEHRTNLPVAE